MEEEEEEGETRKKALGENAEAGWVVAKMADATTVDVNFILYQSVKLESGYL